MGAPSKPDLSQDDTHDLVRQAQSQLKAGDFLGARRTLEAAVRKGNVAAYVELADLEIRLGQRHLAEGHLQKLNAHAVESQDPFLHFVLSGAYQLMLGSADLKEQQWLAFQHLSSAANLGHASAQATLAHWFHHGLNGVAKDTVLFEYWVRRAVDSGDPLAICEYTEHLLATRQPVPRDLAASVRELASQLHEAKRLLNRLPADAA